MSVDRLYFGLNKLFEVFLSIESQPYTFSMKSLFLCNIVVLCLLAIHDETMKTEASINGVAKALLIVKCCSQCEKNELCFPSPDKFNTQGRLCRCIRKDSRWFDNLKN